MRVYVPRPKNSNSDPLFQFVARAIRLFDAGVKYGQRQLPLQPGAQLRRARIIKSSPLSCLCRQSRPMADNIARRSERAAAYCHRPLSHGLRRQLPPARRRGIIEGRSRPLPSSGGKPPQRQCPSPARARPGPARWLPSCGRRRRSYSRHRRSWRRGCRCPCRRRA